MGNSGVSSAQRIAVVSAALLTVGVFMALSSALARADGVALSKGDVIAGNGNGTYKHFDPNGTLLDTLDTTSGAPEDTGVCFDGALNMYTTNFAADSMSVFSQAGNLVNATFGSGFDAHPESCVVDQAGNIYAGQADGSANILKFSPSGALLATYAPTTSPRGTDWIDLAKDQCTMHYTGEGSVIMTFNVCTNAQGPDFATGLPAPCYAHRILPDGGEIVACANEVVRLDSSGSVVKTYTPTTDMFALNLDPDGQTFWVANFAGDVFRINLDTGAQVTHFNTSPTVDVAGLGIVGEPTAAAGNADLSITKGGSPDPVQTGQNLTYTLTVTNNGPTDASGVKVDDPLPAGVTFGSASSDTGTCSGTSAVTCDIGSLANGASAHVTIIVTPTTAGTLSNTATVSATTPDPNPANNSATASSTVTSKTSKVIKCQGTVATIVGTPGNDTLIGTPGPDVIAGQGGNDVIKALGANDKVCGKDGNDKIQGGGGNDELHGGPGKDTISGGGGKDLIKGGGAPDKLKGNGGKDNVRGGGGKDTMSGGGGNDLLKAHGGGDDVQGNGGNDKLGGGAQFDHLNGGSGKNTCSPGPDGAKLVKCVRGKV